MLDVLSQNITLQPPNPAVHIDFRPMQVKNDIFHPTTIASISFTGISVMFTFIVYVLHGLIVKIPRKHRHLTNRAFVQHHLFGTLCQTMFNVTPKLIAIFYPSLKLTILTVHFITISSVSCTT